MRLLEAEIGLIIRNVTVFLSPTSRICCLQKQFHDLIEKFLSYALHFQNILLRNRLILALVSEHRLEAGAKDKSWPTVNMDNVHVFGRRTQTCIVSLNVSTNSGFKELAELQC